jgi:hypothetical protein
MYVAAMPIPRVAQTLQGPAFGYGNKEQRMWSSEGEVDRDVNLETRIGNITEGDATTQRQTLCKHIT